MKADDFDLAIVGSGAAGFAAAIAAHALDARVVMIERGIIGGTCVNIGCVPSKTLLQAAHLRYASEHSPFAGLSTQAGPVDLGQTVAQKNRLVDSLRHEKYIDLAETYGWELIVGEGEARFLDARTMGVGSHRIRAGKFVIATGARPAVPAIPGLVEAGYLTSTEALDLTSVPDSMVVIGAGYIALELGQFFRRMGAHVTLVQRGPQLLAGSEPEVAESVSSMLARDGIDVVTGARIERVERIGAARRVHLTIGERTRRLDATHILVATGRTPNVEELDLPAAGVTIDSQGAIVVDAHLRTANPLVYAAGDVTGAPHYVYVAAYHGGLAARNALSDAGTPADLWALPGVIFTDPHIASVGLTERAARTKGYIVKTSVLPIAAVPRAQVDYATLGVVKLVADATSDRLLGVHAVADNAGEMIGAATLAVKHRLTVGNVVESFIPYLTMTEGFKLAAMAFERDVAKLSCCAT